MAASSSPTICRRDSRSTIRGWCRRETPGRWVGLAMRPSRSIQNSAMTISVRPSIATASRLWSSPLPMWCAQCRPAPTCCRRPSWRTCIVPIAMVAQRAERSPLRLRVDGGGVAVRDGRWNRQHGLRRAVPSAAVAAVMLAAVGAVTLWILSLGPMPRGGSLEFSTAIVDREGRLLRPYATSDGRWRLPARADDVDPRYLELLVAYDDKRFRGHSGVDPLALLRAGWQILTHGRILSGGSTLTMQVARLLEPRAERSLVAKLRQMVRAVEIERMLTKDEVLGLYLNLAPYGGNLEGIRAASLV